MNKNLLKILTIILLFLPFSSFAALDLDYTYPTLPGGQTITTATSLGDVIKYFVAWAIIIGAIIAFLSLIYAGIQYLASTGKPEAMSQAKNRILNSFLGLAILLGSYLILVTLNPQLIVMEVKKEPVASGVVLLNSEAVNELSGSTDPLATLEQLIGSKDAYYLRYDIPDCEEAFGQLAVTERETPPLTNAKKVDFENFQNFVSGGIGFLKNAQGKYKVILYEQKDFKGDITDYAYEYSSEGRIWPASGGIASGEIEDKGAIKIIKLVPPPTGVSEFLGGFNSSVEYANIDMEQFKNFTEEQKEDAETKTSLVEHPPLSIQIKSTPPGIYLYSDKIGEEPEEQPLISNIKDLDDVKFNDKAKRIEIKTDEKTNDYLAILHEDAHWAGQLRIFFEERDDPLWTGGGTPPIIGNTKSSGNVRAEITDVIDKYGKVKKPSSIQVHQLSNDSSVCQEVRICTKPYAEGECLVYTPDGVTELGEYVWLATSTLPVYIPQNIPASIQVRKLKADGTEETPKTANFADNIKSIIIKGDCLVVLFENPVDSSKTPPGFWPKGGPGSHSETFPNPEYPEIKVDNDLTDGNEIGRCGGIWGLGFTQTTPCASAIAIYPIKPK